MKYCVKCGAQQDDKNTFCEYCGTPFSNEVPNQNANNPYQQTDQYGYGTKSYEVDAPNTGFAILGFFIPLAGIILYAIWHKDQPLKAKSCIKGAIAGIALNVIFFVATIICAALQGGYQM